MNPAPRRIRSLLFAPASKPDVLRKLPRATPDAVALDLEDAALQARCEQSIRNHDPCISCAAHFLKLQMHRA